MMLVNVHSLSSIAPVEFVYNSTTPIELSKTFLCYKNGLGYFKHEALNNYKDAALSKRNCLFLTDNISLKDVFETTLQDIPIGKVPSSLYIRNAHKESINYWKNDLVMGGKGEPVLFYLQPLDNGLVELKTDSSTWVQIDKNYPYTARLSQNILLREDLLRQQFEVDHKDGILTLKTLTKEGWRYLTYNPVDKIIRATGLMLNVSTISTYLFFPQFVTLDNERNFAPRNTEVKYFNDLLDSNDSTTLKIKDSEESNTHLLLTCSTNQISKTSKVKMDIALTKTNFSSTGSYNNKKML